MATYFISSVGSNANNGLGPDASHATNRPWLTLGKALNTGSAVVPGDTVYVGPGVLYEGATITPISGVTSTASPTAVRGDPTNAQGFKDGSGVRLAPAVCWVTTRTSGDGLDGAITSGASLLTMTTNTPSGLQFYNLALESSLTASVGVALISLAAGADTLFQDCRLIGNSGIRNTAGAPTATRNLTLRRCVYLGSTFINIGNNTAAATADADLTILVEHCLVFGKLADLALGASGGNIGGGVRFKGNTAITTATILATTAARVSTTTPCRVEGNLFLIGLPISAGTAGHVADDGYNRFASVSAAVNFTAAGTTLTAPQLNLILPDLVKWGLSAPTWGLLGWTNDAVAAQKNSAWSNTSADFRGRTVRPWGAGTSIGYMEQADQAVNSASYLTGSATSGRLTGAGEVTLRVYVPAGTWTIQCRTKSGSYGGTNYPQLIVEANPGVGVSQTTVTATDGTEQVLTTSTLTLSGAAFLEVRLVSRSSGVSSTTDFGTLSRGRA